MTLNRERSKLLYKETYEKVFFVRPNKVMIAKGITIITLLGGINNNNNTKRKENTETNDACDGQEFKPSMETLKKEF